MNKSMFKQVLKYIKKYDTIVIGRHIGADPDCLSSQIALRDTLKLKFPEKKIYAVGAPASRFKFLGKLDRLADDFDYSHTLAIVVDTPDRKRVDSIEVEKCAFSIKMDHHPFIEEMCSYEVIDDTASSAAQIIMEFIFEMNLPLTSNIAETLYAGLIADTNRYLSDYTTPKTFEIVSKLVKKVPMDLNKIYHALYMRPLAELRFMGYIKQNLTVTDNGLAYIKIEEETLEKFGVNPASAGNMINDFNYIKEFTVWVFFTEEVKNSNIRVGVRSRGPIINDTLEKFNGGGHLYAAGARIMTFLNADEIILALDKRCAEYNEKLK